MRFALDLVGPEGIEPPTIGHLHVHLGLPASLPQGFVT